MDPLVTPVMLMAVIAPDETGLKKTNASLTSHFVLALDVPEQDLLLL